MIRTLAAASLLLAIGCSSSSSTTTTDAAADTEAAPRDATDADGDCNAVVQLGAMVTAVCEPGAAPAATGGTIADGQYVLVESRFFGACPGSDLAETLLVSGATVQSLATTAAGQVTRKSLTYAVTGTTMLQTQTCPVSVMTRGQFTATPTTLTISLANGLTTRVSIFAHL